MHDWPVIHTYSRKQAIEDGVLVDLTEQAQTHGFKIPVACTEAVFASVVEWTDADEARFKGQGQSQAGRLNDLLSMAWMCALANRQLGTDTAFFPMLRIDRSSNSKKPRRIDLQIHVGPGDTVDPVLTIMLHDES